MNPTYSIFALIVILAGPVSSCNEFVCGSVVSKCLLTQSCQCKLTDCFCCKDCLNCLGELYTECCSCLEMCPTQNATQAALSPKSQIGDFEGGIAALFDTLTEIDDDKWTTYRFPMKAGLKRQFDATGHIRDDIDRQAAAAKTSHKIPTAAAVSNCTVIFLNTCTSNKKCMQYCESMGASSYRWFHDGCCECVGAECINYGINESKCTQCPETENDDEEEEQEQEKKLNMNLDAFEEDYEDDETWDYGEEETNFNY